MANKATPKKFAMQQVFKLLLRRPSDKSIVAYLTDVKTSGLDNTVEMVYPVGGQGNVYIGGGFAHSRRATFNVSTATWNIDVMALQNGTEVQRDTSEVTYYDLIQADGTGTLKTTFTALGATGTEIGFVYKLNDDGTHEKEFIQDAETAASGKFTYATATKTFTFDTSERPIAGDYYECAYTYRPSGSERITVEANAIPSVALVTAFGIARDICNGELYPAQVEGQVQIDGNWSFDLAADGDPAVQNLNMEFVKGCLESKLYNFTVFTEEEGE